MDRVIAMSDEPTATAEEKVHWSGSPRIRLVVAVVLSIAMGALLAVVVIDGRDVDWNWGAIADVAVGVAALVAAIGGYFTLRDRRRAEERAEWWKRADRAIEYLVSGDGSKRDMAAGLLDALEFDDARTKRRERDYFDAISTHWLLDETDNKADNDAKEGGSHG